MPPRVMCAWPGDQPADSTSLRGRPRRGIRVEGISKRFGSTTALNGVSLTVPAGAVAVLMGRNGAGKTTLIRILATTVVPDAGGVWIDGVDLLRDPAEARRHLGLVLAEERSHYWRISGRRNLEFFAALRGMKRSRARRAASDAIARVGLDEVSDRRVDRYSTGMRSRLALARALLGSPPVLLLDEPTRSVDPPTAAAFRRMVREMADNHDMAVLMTTHDVREASDLADRVAIVESGRVIAVMDGPVPASGIEKALSHISQ